MVSVLISHDDILIQMRAITFKNFVMLRIIRQFFTPSLMFLLTLYTHGGIFILLTKSVYEKRSDMSKLSLLF